MSEELDKILAGGEKKDQAPASGEKKPEQNKDQEEEKKKVQLANLNKAIEEGNKELKKIRDAKKAEKAGKTQEPDEEDETPSIDFNDPGAKAWDKHISSVTDPLKKELEQEKDEIRTYALKQFLNANPLLAKDPEKVKQVMNTYGKIRTASERTVEGVLIDLKKAYVAEYSDEILSASQNDKIERAQGEAIFSDIAVSRGSSSFREEKEKAPHISAEDAAILAKWGMSPDEWVKMKKEQDKKA